MEIIKAVSGVFALRAYVCLIIFSIAGHLISIFLRLDPGFVAPAASFSTLVLGVIASNLEFWKVGGRNAIYRSVAVLVLGFFVEILGLKTGIPFGPYHYTDRWWPTVPLVGISHFPLLLPFAWLMVTGAAALGCRVTSSRPLNALLAALVATALDLVMEGALAGKLGYWSWEAPGPLPGGSPWSNSASWLGLSFLAALIFSEPPVQVSRRAPAVVLLGQVALMIALFWG